MSTAPLTSGLCSELTVRLPFAIESARSARSVLTALLGQFAVGGQSTDDAVLVAHELIANSVNHGEPDEQMLLELSCSLFPEHLDISVTDQGTSGAVAAGPLTHDGPGGRGLAIVEAVSSQWSVDRSHGTRVSARLSL